MLNKIFQTGLFILLIFLFACSSQKLATVDGRGQEVVEEQRELIQKNVKILISRYSCYKSWMRSNKNLKTSSNIMVNILEKLSG